MRDYLVLEVETDLSAEFVAMSPQPRFDRSWDRSFGGGVHSGNPTSNLKRGPSYRLASSLRDPFSGSIVVVRSTWPILLGSSGRTCGDNASAAAVRVCL